MNAKEQMEKKVFAYIAKHHMFEAGDKVIAGISGGADSVCLLFMLFEWAKHTPLSIEVVHVNHGIRKEASEDAEYVRRLCAQLEVPFHLVEADVKKLSKEWNCSEEEAGRMLRYQAFHGTAQDVGATKIAVAHNSNDRSETMLFHMFRGSGIRGLGSIRPVRDMVVRPLLCLERGEIETYLRDRNIAYCTDSTNETDHYTRNKIRHHILPYIEREIAPGAVARMAQTADMLTETDEYLEQQTQKAFERCVNGNIVDVAGFLEEHPVIQKRLLRRLICVLAGSEKDISYVHIEELLTLFYEDAHRTVSLPYSLKGLRRYTQVLIQKSGSQKQDIPATKEIEIPATGKLTIALGDDGELTLEVMEREEKSTDFPQNQYTKWFDYDKIKQSLVLRTRNVGDYLTIAGNDGRIIHKSVKDYMLTEKIPREKRDRLYLLAEGEHVIWLIGYRISEHYKISGDTKRILQVQFNRKSLER